MAVSARGDASSGAAAAPRRARARPQGVTGAPRATKPATKQATKPATKQATKQATNRGSKRKAPAAARPAVGRAAASPPGEAAARPAAKRARAGPMRASEPDGPRAPPEPGQPAGLPAPEAGAAGTQAQPAPDASPAPHAERELGGGPRRKEPQHPPMPPQEVAEAVLGAPRPSRLVRAMPFIGAALALAGLVALAVVWRTRPDQVKPILSGIGLLFTLGKEAAIPAAVFGAGELLEGEPADPWLVGGFVWLADVAAVALVYAIVHRMLDGAQSRANFLGHMLRSAQRRADRKRKLVDRYGPIGLFLFLIVPFAFNSPLVGIVLGRASGMRPTQIAPVLLLAISTTALGWTLLCVYGLKELDRSYSWVPLALSLGVTAAVLLTGFVASRREKALGRDALRHGE